MTFKPVRANNICSFLYQQEVSGFELVDWKGQIMFLMGHPSLFLFFVFTKYSIQKFSSHLDLNSDLWSRRQGRWPLYHHHRPKTESFLFGENLFDLLRWRHRRSNQLSDFWVTRPTWDEKEAWKLFSNGLVGSDWKKLASTRVGAVAERPKRRSCR